MPTSLISGSIQSQVVLAAVRDTSTGNDGVWRSLDAGVTWTRLSGDRAGLPAGGVGNLIDDPGNAFRFYAAIPGQGIFMTSNAGNTWTAINTGLTSPTAATRIEMAVHNDASNNVLYAALLTNGTDTTTVNHTAIYRSTNQGTTWTQMHAPGDANGGLFQGGQQSLHFAIAADPTSPTVVFVSGDREPNTLPAANGADNYTGREFRGDAAQATGSQWASLDANGAHGTSPHADSRNLKFDANGNLIQANDGGLYPPDLPQRRRLGAGPWGSINGNLANTEVYSASYDDVNHTIVAGAPGCRLLRAGQPGRTRPGTRSSRATAATPPPTTPARPATRSTTPSTPAPEPDLSGL